MPPIALLQAGVLGRKVKSPGDFLAGQHLKGGGTEGLHSRETSPQIQIAAEPVELTRQFATDLQTGIVEPRGQGKVPGGIIGSRGIPGLERLVSHTKVGRLGHEGLSLDADIARQPLGMWTADMTGNHPEIGMLRPGL